MPIRTRIRELHEVLAGFLERDEPGVLVVHATDDEILYLAHVLEQLDAESPADRIFVAPDPFHGAEDYVGALAARIAAEYGPPDAPVTATPALRCADSSSRVHAALTALVDDLPAGDHRLVCALIPASINDPAGFAALLTPLLAGPFPNPLRLVLRDDPRHPLPADTWPSTRVLAYDFRLPASVVVKATAITAFDPARLPDERAQALLQLAVRELGFSNHQPALAICETAACLAQNPALIALTFAIHADVLRAAGEFDNALHSAAEALRRATDAHALPTLHHAAMTLGEIFLHLGSRSDASTCFNIAERAALNNPAAQALARERFSSLLRSPPC